MKKTARSIVHRTKTPAGRKRVRAAILSPKARSRAVRLTEDEADAVVGLRRMTQKECSLEEAASQLGYDVGRPVQR